MKLTEDHWKSAPEFGRRESLIDALKLLDDVHDGPVTIVETGTLRDPNSKDGDGWSTIAWGWFCSLKGGLAYTVDVDEGALTLCRSMTAEYSNHLRYVCRESIEFLKQWDRVRGPIHLLYLDSLDYLTDYAASERHNAAEFQAALPHLASPSIVLIDDTHPAQVDPRGLVTRWYGKGGSTVPLAAYEGFRIVSSLQGQVLLARR